MRHTIYVFDGFHLDVTRRKLISSGGLIQPLNSRAMEALLLLVANAGQLVEKRRLMETVWPAAIVEDNNLNQCILAIRKALGETAGSNRYIMTVPGRGYRFVSPVQTVTQESLADTDSGGSDKAGMRHRLLAALWVGAAIAVGVAVILLSKARWAVPTATPAAGTADTSPAMVLRLREPPAVAGGAQTTSTAALARCLAQRRDMKLRVIVQLVSKKAGAEPVWSGEYLADAQDLLTLEPSAAGDSGCSQLITAATGHQ